MPRLKIIRRGEFQPWLGVFETICVRGGRPILLEAHWRSLQKACLALGLGRPLDFRSFAESLPNADGRWRWVVGPQGANHSFQRERRKRMMGVTLLLASVRLGSANLDARFKTFSYLTHWQARRENPKGESLVLNERGHIVSGAMSNIFWVWRGRVYTPAEECGCRAGVVRDWVLAEASVRLARSRPAILESADEIFVTNSLLGVRPVIRWRNRRLRPGLVTRMLRDRYEQMVRAA